MPLPIPGLGPEDQNKPLPKLNKLPSLDSLPPLDDFEEETPRPKKKRSAPTPSQRQRPAGAKKTKPQSKDSGVFEDEDGKLWEIDAETGIKHRVIRKTSKETLEAAKRSNGSFGTISDLLRYGGEMDEDFNVDDLDGAANLFMAHLRVPPDEEEIKRLRAERAQREKIQNREYSEYTEEMDEADDARREKEDAQLNKRMEKWNKKN